MSPDKYKVRQSSHGLFFSCVSVWHSDLLERLRFCWRTAQGFFSPRWTRWWSQSVLSSLCEQLLWTPWWEKLRLKKNNNNSSDSQLLCLKVEFYFESPLCSKLSHMFCRPMRWAVMLPRAKQYETNRQTYFKISNMTCFFLRRKNFPHVKLDERNVESENGNNPEDLKFLLTGFSVNLFVSFGKKNFPPNNPAWKLFSSWGEILSVCFTMKKKKDYWKNKSC